MLDGDGKWTCPPAQAVARTYGFNYRIWTSREVDPILLRNIEFLADYFGAEEIEIPVAVTKRLQEVVSTEPGIGLAEVRRRCPEVTADQMNFSLARAMSVCAETGVNLGRPWISILLDGFSRRNLAFVLSPDPPSYRTLMMLFRRCVERHERLPRTLVIDGGPEFRSSYFETLAAACCVLLKRRPPGGSDAGQLLDGPTKLPDAATATEAVLDLCPSIFGCVFVICDCHKTFRPARRIRVR